MATPPIPLDAAPAASSRTDSPGGLRAQLFKGGVGSLALKVASILLSFLTVMLLTRLLGPRQYGIYSFALAVVTLLVIPTQLGLPQLLVRQVASYGASGQWGLMRGILVRGNQLTGALSVATMLVTWLVLWAVRPWQTREMLLTLAVAALLVPLNALGALRLAALRGLKFVVLGQMPDVLVRYGVFLVLLAAAWLAHDEGQLGVATAMGMRVVAVAATFAVGAVLLWQRTPPEVKRATPEYQTRQWTASATHFLFIGGMQLINAHTDVLMLGIFRPKDEVGIYSVAVQVSLLISFPLVAANMVAAPTVARLWLERNMRQLREVATWTSRAALVASLPAALVFMALGAPLLSLVFGPEYRAGAAALAILSLGQLINSAAGPVGTLMNMTGHERDTARAVAIAAVTNVVLNLGMIPLLGSIGAAVATAMSYIIWNSLLVVRTWQTLGVDSTALGRHPAARPSAPR